jgi:hypothetical protein
MDVFSADLTMHRKGYGISSDDVYWTKVVFGANGAASLAALGKYLS